MTSSSPARPYLDSIGFLEVGNLAPTFLVVDRISKSADIHILGIESTDGTGQCIKFVGSADAVREAARQGEALARKMGTTVVASVLARPEADTVKVANQPPQYSPLLELFDARIPKEEHMTGSDAIGLLETQGLVAALHATDTMLKSASVKLVGKEKIGAAYVTIMIRGDVAAVQAAIDAGKQVVNQLGGKLILADVIPRPHPELAALLPK